MKCNAKEQNCERSCQSIRNETQQFRGRRLRTHRRPIARMTGQKHCRLVSKRSTLPDHYTKLSKLSALYLHSSICHTPTYYASYVSKLSYKLAQPIFQLHCYKLFQLFLELIKTNTIKLLIQAGS